MTTTQIALDKKAHPLMMHLSILPKYGIAGKSSSYDPITQTQTFNTISMSNSWCTENASTGAWLLGYDDDQQEDD